jgi:hypothetical protein
MKDAFGRLIGVKAPVRIVEPDLEWCCYCGSPTIFGAYLRANPDEMRCRGAKDSTPCHGKND